MNLVARRAGDLVLRVAALQAADVRRLIQMAGETDLVGRRGGQLRGIADVGGATRIPYASARARGRIRRRALRIRASYRVSTTSCGLFANALKISSWQAPQASEPA